MGSSDEIIIKSAQAGIQMIDESGRMPAGHNGPYKDPETNVRNTAHWSIVFVRAWELTGRTEFKKAAETTINYLCTSEVRPTDSTFHARDVENKDSSNGLIGQAWAIEGLVTAVNAGIGGTRPLEIAQQVFHLHPFHEDLSLWQTVEIDGTVNGFDLTFNHQLWFAAVGGLLAEHDPIAREKVSRFLDNLVDTIDVSNSGLIRHPLNISLRLRDLIGTAPRNRLWLMLPLPATRVAASDNLIPDKINNIIGASNKTTYHKEIGYHSFNLYALAMLHNKFPTHPAWSSNKIQKAIEFASKKEYVGNLSGNKYGYPYNPPGFEVAYALSEFDVASPDIISKWIFSQLKECYNWKENLMNQSTPDPATHAARIYELTRLPNIQIKHPKI